MFIPGVRACMAALGLCAVLGAQGFRPEDQVRAFTRENGTEVESFRWSGYTVRFIPAGRGNPNQLCQIRNSKGQVLREIRAFRFVTPSLEADHRAALLRDFNGDGREDLRITAWSGGAYGQYVDYLFDSRPGKGLRNLLIYEGGEGKIGKAGCHEPEIPETPLQKALEAGTQDLDGDGLPELILADHGIHHVTGSTHGPTTVLILAWRGSRYVDATSRFPEYPRDKARQEQRQIVFNPPQGLDAGGSDHAAGYLANSILAGEEQTARAWLLQAGGVQAESWLATHAPEVKRGLQGIGLRIKQSQARTLWGPGWPRAALKRGPRGDETTASPNR